MSCPSSYVEVLSSFPLLAQFMYFLVVYDRPITTIRPKAVTTQEQSCKFYSAHSTTLRRHYPKGWRPLWLMTTPLTPPSWHILIHTCIVISIVVCHRDYLIGTGKWFSDAPFDVINQKNAVLIYFLLVRPIWRWNECDKHSASIYRPPGAKYAPAGEKKQIFPEARYRPDKKSACRPKCVPTNFSRFRVIWTWPRRLFSGVLLSFDALPQITCADQCRHFKSYRHEWHSAAVFFHTASNTGLILRLE